MFKTALMLLPVFAIVALAFWLILPSRQQTIIVNDHEERAEEQITGINDKISQLENKVNTLESSNSALLSKLSQLQTGSTKVQSVPTSKKSPVLIPINPGGTVDSTSWTNLTSGNITIDPADYPGYKNAYLIINLSVYVGQGTAYARLVNAQNGLAIIPSTVSTNSYLPVSLTSSPFQLPTGSNQYTIQLYTQVPGYPAQAADSFLQITY